MKLLTDSVDSNGEPDMENPVYIAKKYEALAKCHFEAGDREPALKMIKKSIDAMNYPGRAMEIARRYQLKAEILTEMGMNQQAVTELQNAEILFQKIDLDNHPELHSTRVELGCSLARINQFEKAEELLLDNLNTLSGFNTFTYSLIKEETVRGIVDLYLMWGRDDQAEVFTAQLAQLQSEH
jgi:tetratricopeptide (TPR) repeat protein